MSWFLKSRGTKLERSMFNEFMDLLRLNEEKDFCDNIFYLFDEDKDNYIDYKDLILGLKLSSTDTYFSKVSCKI
jgi:Ca2+-binding EF-hand superfamily protein